jgi:aminopeptidase-like protein
LSGSKDARGKAMIELVAELYPICRSITGDGVRETLRILGRHLPLEVREVPSGTPVFDWTVPPEWNIRDAWIKTTSGERLVDFRRSNLHVVSYSTPVAPRRISLADLREHLHSLPEQPDWIPYRTSYYEETWGFCLTQKQLELLTDAEYEICIDATLEPGHLSYGEYLLPGATDDEVLISTHVCHPSLCNDNLSGIAVSVWLARELASRRTRRYSYRFLYIPGTIGSITWLAQNRERAHRIRHGLTLICLGDERGLTYKRTFGGSAEIDRAAEHVLAQSGEDDDVVDFFPYGYDERQFNSPGFRLPVGSLMRGRHGRFPEYHTSADDLDLVRPEQLSRSFETVLSILDLLEENRRYRSLAPYGEPQLGKRGVYRALGGESDPSELQLAMLWVLAFSDGEHALLDVAERSGLPFARVRSAADLLAEHDLLEEAPARGARG